MRLFVIVLHDDTLDVQVPDKIPIGRREERVAGNFALADLACDELREDFLFHRQHVEMSDAVASLVTYDLKAVGVLLIPIAQNR
jgi:hypothetical protein